MEQQMGVKFGLIGTITHDLITVELGQSFDGIGGVLYQAAVLCGLGEEVFLYTNLGEELVPEVEKIIENWPTLRKEGIRLVPGPGNKVQLHYPERGERVETLKSVVPPSDPRKVIEDVHKLGMLVLIINSGFDIRLEDWRSIVASAECPIWLDIHSLPLSRNLNSPRRYLPLKEWRKWSEGASYLQANKQEVASMLSHPNEVPSETEMLSFGKMAFELGVKAVFITLGKEGLLVMAPKKSKRVRPPEIRSVIDTTGCGDVFCAGTVAKLAEGKDPFEAASFGLLLASKAVGLSGIEDTYTLALSRKII